MELGTLTWSDSQFAKLLPIPNSDKSAIIADSNAVYSAFTQKCLLSFENKTTENFEVGGYAK